MRLPTTQRLGEIAISLMGIWFAVQALVTVGAYLSLNLEPNFQPVSLARFLPLGVYFLSAVFLLTFRRRLAQELFRSTEPTVASEHADSSELQDFAVAILGIWIMVMALSSAATTEANLLFGSSPDDYESLFGGSRARTMISTDAWIARLPYLVELICGAILFSTSGHLVRLWKNLRELGDRR